VSERLARTADRLQGRIDAALELHRSTFDRLAAQLDALSPLKVLGRGYAVPLSPDGRVLKHKADFTPEQPFDLRVVDGVIRARPE
jgi:exodeoxyribonuclease VII large subunit